MEPKQPNLGTCCVCNGVELVNNIMMLSMLAPVPGHGWGCMQCDTEMNGAVAVVCDPCFSKYEGIDPSEWLKTACRGWPGVDGRIPIAELTGQFDHDRSKHPEGIDYYDADIKDTPEVTQSIQ